MQIYNISDKLPLYKSYSGEYVNPPIDNIIIFENANELYLKHTDNENFNIVTLKTDETLDDAQNNLEDYIDNDDIDFVMNNIHYGEKAERFIKDLMIKMYGNCNKVEAKEGFDFEVIVDGTKIQIEVKSLRSYNSPFHITINEIKHAISYSESYFIGFVIIPSLEKDVRDVKFVRNPIKNLGIAIPEIEYTGKENKCVIIPEKFLIKPVSGFVKGLPNTVRWI